MALHRRWQTTVYLVIDIPAAPNVDCMDIFAFDAATFMSFLLTLIRVSLIVFLLPFYGGDTIPQLVKASLCLVLTLALFPHLSFPGSLFPGDALSISLLVVGEIMMGLTMALCVHFIFAGIQTGGELFAMQMGFTMMSLVDPLTGNRISVTSHLLYMVSMALFLLFDGHLYLLSALAESFTLVPPGAFVFNANLVSFVLQLSVGMFVLALKIAAPLLAILLMIELALALMGRAAPQMNLLTMGFPIKIAVGFFFMGMLFTIIAEKLQDIIRELYPLFRTVLSLGS